jgi:hypothetical protein
MSAFSCEPKRTGSELVAGSRLPAFATYPIV